MLKYTDVSASVNPSPATASANSLKSFLQPQESGTRESLPLYNNRQTRQNLSLSESSNIGLDTFSLTFPVSGCTISPDFVAQIAASTKSDGTFEKDPCVLWKDTTGRSVYGAKAFLNTPNFNLTISPIPVGVYVTINASARAFAENNADTMHEARFRNVIQLIESELFERGLNCNLFYVPHFNRMDISRNVHLEHICPAYISMFRNYSRARGAQFRRVAHDDSTFDLRMRMIEVSIYDKGKEQAEKARTTKKRVPASHTMRGEVRFLKTREVGKQFDVKKLSPAALLDDGGFSEFPSLHRRAMETSFFDTERLSQDAVIMNHDNAKQLGEIERRVAQLAIAGSAEYNRLVVYALHVAAYGVDGARAWYVENVQQGETEAAKRKRQRFEKELHRVAAILGAVVEESSGLMHDELYSELKAKMLK